MKIKLFSNFILCDFTDQQFKIYVQSDNNQANLFSHIVQRKSNSNLPNYIIYSKASLCCRLK
jgi:hypothetical protein